MAVVGLEVEGQCLHLLEHHTYAESDKNAHRLHLAVPQPLRESLSVTQHFFAFALLSRPVLIPCITYP